MSKYNHFEMCEKIFGQQYKWNEQKDSYEPYSRTDMWNKLIEQQKQVTDLEAKLAESEEIIKYLKGIKRYDIGEMLTENAQLKQQLAEKESTINTLIQDNNASKEWYKKQLAESEEKINMLEEHKFYADNIIQAYADKCKNSQQDKISFAVEQLNLLYKTLTTEDVWRAMKKGWWLNNNECLQLKQLIDNQIKQLKEMK